jgi:hypothetical protein
MNWIDATADGKQFLKVWEKIVAIAPEPKAPSLAP